MPEIKRSFWGILVWEVETYAERQAKLNKILDVANHIGMPVPETGINPNIPGLGLDGTSFTDRYDLYSIRAKLAAKPLQRRLAQVGPVKLPK